MKLSIAAFPKALAFSFCIVFLVSPPINADDSEVIFSFEVIDEKTSSLQNTSNVATVEKKTSASKDQNFDNKPATDQLIISEQAVIQKNEEPNIHSTFEANLKLEPEQHGLKLGSPEKLIELIEKSPELLSALENIQVSRGKIAKLEANFKPQIALSTSGNVPLISSLKPGDRGYRTDKRFVDLKADLTQTLFDFGKNSHLISAEERRKEAKEIEFEAVKRLLFFEAIEFGINVSRSERLLSALNFAIDANTKRLDIEKRRYKRGSGTVASVRDISLIQVENLNQQQLLEFEIENSKKLFKAKFGVEIDTYITEINSFIDQIPLELKDHFFPSELDEIRKLQIELDAIDEEIFAVEKTNHPNLNLSLTANSYDIFSESMSEYEILGGLTVSKPIFDGGLNKSQKSVLLSQKLIAKSKVEQRVRTLNEDWQNNISEFSDSNQKMDNLNFQIYELSEKLKILEMMAKGSTSQGTELAKLENRIFSLKREKIALDWKIKKVVIRSLLLSEELI